MNNNKPTITTLFEVAYPNAGDYEYAKKMAQLQIESVTKNKSNVEKKTND